LNLSFKEFERFCIDLTSRINSLLKPFPSLQKFSTKEDGTPVTEEDQKIEKYYRSEIHKTFPEHAISGEEFDDFNTNSDYQWIVDPIDGTTNYLRGLGHYAVSIALQIRGRIEHGVIYDPTKEELFTASRGEGAFLNSHRIRVSGREGLEGAVLATAFPFRYRRLLPAYRAMFDDLFEDIEDIRRQGTSCLDLAYVACGRLDGYWELGLKPWDLAAGALMVQEAGGVVMDMAGGERWMQSGHIIAAPFKLITPMRHAIEPHLTEAILAKLKAQ